MPENKIMVCDECGVTQEVDVQSAGPVKGTSAYLLQTIIGISNNLEFR